MYATRFMLNLSDEEVSELEKLLKNHKLNEREKCRIRAILLSYQGYTIDEISYKLDVDRDTISIWFNNWETYKALGLLDKEKNNRKPKMSDDDLEVLRRILDKNPRSAKEVSVELEKETGKKLSLSSIRKWSKRLGFSWKRMRKSLKSKRNEQDFKQCQADIEGFVKIEEKGEASIFYFDATGFDLTPSIPYAWQPIGQEGTVGIPSAKSKRLNVLGFFGRDELQPFVVEGAVTAAVVKACFDNFCEENHSDKPIIVILDNAPVHTARIFLDSIEDWQAQGVFPYFISPYSPELNLIEILWKKMKYSWLSSDAYENFHKLKKSVEEILVGYGAKYQICFC